MYSIERDGQRIYLTPEEITNIANRFEHECRRDEVKWFMEQNANDYVDFTGMTDEDIDTITDEYIEILDWSEAYDSAIQCAIDEAIRRCC